PGIVGDPVDIEELSAEALQLAAFCEGAVQMVDDRPSGPPQTNDNVTGFRHANLLGKCSGRESSGLQWGCPNNYNDVRSAAGYRLGTPCRRANAPNLPGGQRHRQAPVVGHGPPAGTPDPVNRPSRP